MYYLHYTNGSTPVCDEIPVKHLDGTGLRALDTFIRAHIDGIYRVLDRHGNVVMRRRNCAFSKHTTANLSTEVYV